MAPKKETPEKPVFPMRINKYLALKKHSTRRGADELIKKRQVFINGRLAVLGDKIKESDNVEVKFKGKKPDPYVYIAYNKPRGMATYYAGAARNTGAGPAGDSGEEEVGYPAELKNVFAVGGLDKGSHGLIILTNDGRITENLLSSKYGCEREYFVSTKNTLRSSFKQKMEAGLKIEDEQTKKCKVKVLNEKSFRVILTEEKKHQVRRMCAALFQEVENLQRVRIMNVSLGSLKAGSWRRIEGEELKKFLGDLL